MAYSKDVRNAVEECASGASMRATAHKYGIPQSTLHDHDKVLHIKRLWM